MDGEQRLLQAVTKLQALMGIHDAPDSYVESMADNIAPYRMTDISIVGIVRKLSDAASAASGSPRAATAFQQKYKQMKGAGDQELDRFLYLMTKIMDDQDIMSRLASAPSGRAGKTAGKRKARDPDRRKSDLSREDVSKIRKQLYTATKGAELSPGYTLSPHAKRALARVTEPSSVALPVAERPSLEAARAPHAVSPWAPSARASVVGSRPAAAEEEGTVHLASVPVAVQERAAVEDLLNVLMGMSGQYIRVEESVEGVRHTVDAELDRSLADLVHRILPLARDYMRVQAFLEEGMQYSAGRVRHALCAAMRALVDEFLVMVAQLESQFRQGKVNLQKLWYHVEPTLRSMSVMAAVGESVTSLRGGMILSVLYEKERTMSGDQLTGELLLHLMQKAAVPYFHMLSLWICKGAIDDPYDEFMVVEHAELVKENLREDFNDSYWEKRYTIRCPEDQVCKFLAPLSDKILTAGKYLNVIRECGISIESPYTEIQYTPNTRDTWKDIEAAYRFASKSLLDLLLADKDLMGHLASIKKYFFLDQGDFFVHFMDSAEEELRKSVADIEPTKLHSLLELSLRISTAQADPYKDSLSFELLPYNLLNQLLSIIHVSPEAITVTSTLRSMSTQHLAAGVPTEKVLGVESFTFDYSVEWPLSIVLSRKALTKYQLIFRHLFHLRNVERRLHASWLDHQTTKGFRVQQLLRPFFTLRTKMVHFVRTLQHFTMADVLEPQWHQLMAKLRTASTVDEVLVFHNDFLDTALKECMLTNPTLLQQITIVLQGCLIFSKFTATLPAKLSVGGVYVFSPAFMAGEDRQDRTKAQTETAMKVVGSAKFKQMVSTFTESFDVHIKAVMTELAATGGEKHLFVLYETLNQNGYYSKAFDLAGVAR